MKLNLEIRKKPIELDKFINEKKIELSPFQFSLEELSQYVNGSIYMNFNDIYCVSLDLFYDFSVCFDDIIISIQKIKENLKVKDYIWFCEQGSDFYFYYDCKGEYLELSYIKGSNAGKFYKNIPDFTVKVNKLEYVKEWEKVFQKLTIVFKEKFNKKVELPY